MKNELAAFDRLLLPGSSRFGKIKKDDDVCVIAHCCAGSDVSADDYGDIMLAREVV